MKLKKEKKDKKMQFKYVDDDGNSKVIDSFGTLNTEQIQEVIKKIIYWYNIKFPDSDLIIDKNQVRVKNVTRKINSDYMTMERFNSRLPISVIRAFECKYINNYNIDTSILDNVVKLDENCSYVFINLMSKNIRLFRRDYSKDCLIISNSDGMIVSILGNNLLINEIRKNCETINLDQLLYILKKSENNTLNFYYLDECVTKRKRDVATREKIINIIAKELLFSATRSEYGYFRACEFIKDFNNLYNLNLNTSYLDDIIRKTNYNNDTLKRDELSDKKNKALVKSKKSCYG